MRAALIKDGTCLKVYFNILFGRFASTAEEQRQVCDSLSQFPEELTYSSFCSGSAMDGDVMDAAQALLRSIGVRTTFICQSNCECAPKKQQWLLHRYSQHAQPPCLLADIKYVMDGSAPCLQHGPRSMKYLCVIAFTFSTFAFAERERHI